MPTLRYRVLGIALGGTVMATAIGTVTAPATAIADPVGDFLCSVGSTAPEFCLAAPPPRQTPPRAEPDTAPPKGPPFYWNCTEARAAGAAPLYRWSPGYSPRLDPDGDGIACRY